MTTDPIKLDRYKQTWRRAILSENEGAWLKSEVAAGVLYDAGGDKATAYATWGEIGVSPNTKATLYRMAHARKVVDDRDVWLAAGWSGVQKLVKLSLRERKKKIASLRKEIAKGEKPRRAAARLLPKPERKQNPSGNANPPARNAPNTHITKATKLLDVVLDDLSKLAAFNPAILDLVSSETRVAVESRQKRKTA